MQTTGGMMFKMRLAASVISVLLALFFCRDVDAQTRKTYLLAVIPQVPPVEIHKRWGPFVELLSKELGCDIKLITYATIPQFEVDVLAGNPDFSFMNPYQAVVAKRKQGYRPLLKDKTDVYGYIVANSKSERINSIKDLQNQEIGFPAPNAFFASLYLRALLTEKEKIRFIPRYLKTHANVYRNVVQGTILAGGAASSTLGAEPQSLKEHLKIIYRTPPLTSHPIAVHPRIPKSFSDTFTQTVIRLSRDSRYKDIFAAILMKEPVSTSYTRDFLPLERLGLEKYWGNGE